MGASIHIVTYLLTSSSFAQSEEAVGRRCVESARGVKSRKGTNARPGSLSHWPWSVNQNFHSPTFNLQPGVSVLGFGLLSFNNQVTPYVLRAEPLGHTCLRVCQFKPLIGRHDLELSRQQGKNLLDGRDGPEFPHVH